MIRGTYCLGFILGVPYDRKLPERHSARRYPGSRHCLYKSSARSLLLLDQVKV